ARAGLIVGPGCGRGGLCEPLPRRSLRLCICLSRLPPPPRSTLFPYTTLFRSLCVLVIITGPSRKPDSSNQVVPVISPLPLSDHQDRKSTRLNSSHVASSYAVFCLKKKNKGHTPPAPLVPHTHPELLQNSASAV